jgi:hypothetical protein
MVRGPPPNYPPPGIGLSISLHIPNRLLECLVASLPRGVDLVAATPRSSSCLLLRTRGRRRARCGSCRESTAAASVACLHI